MMAYTDSLELMRDDCSRLSVISACGRRRPYLLMANVGPTAAKSERKCFFECTDGPFGCIDTMDM